MYGKIVTPGAFYARPWVNSLTTLQCRDLFYLVLNFYTPLAIFFFASMLYDLVISRGEEEIEKPDLTVVFYTDIAASCVPVYANQTWSFLHMILSTGPQSSEPSYQQYLLCFICMFISFMYIDLCSFHMQIQNICAIQTALLHSFSQWTLRLL